MSQAVVIKSNKYGINLVLDKTMPFRELLVAIKEKFLESEKFFKDAKMAISFEGRELTQEEEYQIIETITENTSISIICIVDNDESHADLVKQQIDAYYDCRVRPGRRVLSRYSAFRTGVGECIQRRHRR